MSFTYSVATQKEEIDAVAHVVTRVYRAAGYLGLEEESTISSFLYDPEYALSIAARMDDEVVGTISVVKDGPAGLPMDSIFRVELTDWREKASSLVEVCQFAIDKTLFAKDTFILKNVSETELALELLGLTIEYCRRTHVSHVVFAVNPKHRLFYEALGATKIGVEKSYPSVNNAPAVAYVLDITDLSSSIRGSILKRALQQVEKIAMHIFPSM